MPEFQDRLEYLDERYDHLRKCMKQLKSKTLELENQAILKNEEEEEDESSQQLVAKIVEDIKREKQILRDEASIIRGELAQATYKEEGRRCMTGEKRREEEAFAKRDEILAERERKRKEREEEMERQRIAMIAEEQRLEEERKWVAERDKHRMDAIDRLKNLHLHESIGQSSGPASPVSNGPSSPRAFSPSSPPANGKVRAVVNEIGESLPGKPVKSQSKLGLSKLFGRKKSVDKKEPPAPNTNGLAMNGRATRAS